MSSVHCVVVWEYQSGGQWLPHTPGVARTLERAHAKKLTRVVLADADPELKGHYVNLRTLTQCLDTSEGGTVECLVRRQCYSVQSAGGRGARWEWARLTSPPLPLELNYEPLPMEVQCVLEEAWCLGSECVSVDGWAVSVARGTARRGAALRLVRRAPQPPYPLTRSAAPPPPAPPERAARTVPGRRPRIPQQYTGSSVHSVQSTVSNLSTHSIVSNHSNLSTHSNLSNHSSHSDPVSATCRGGARSVSPRDKKPGLARQILHNLNIFNHNNNKPAGPRARPGADGRRHSVDTVSTYLSHESKRGSVGELLNCSGASDDAFECPQPQPELGHDHSVGVEWSGATEPRSGATEPWSGATEPWSGATEPWSAATEPWSGATELRSGATDPRSGATEPRSGATETRSGATEPWSGATEHCPRQGGAGCVRGEQEEPLYIECLACGHVYGKEQPAAPAATRPPRSLAWRLQHAALPQLDSALTQPPGSMAWRLQHAALPQLDSAATQPPGSMAWHLQHAALPQLDSAATQPPGSMAWRLQHVALPQLDTATSILVTYNFQSGRQREGQPAPGAPYYAVGFPRHSLLPDTALGRQVLSALRLAWERRVLFTVCASRTTGREHVVAWRVAPPPAAARHYAPPAEPQRLLSAALARLHVLLHPQP